MDDPNTITQLKFPGRKSSKYPIGAMGNVVPLNKFQSIVEHLKTEFKGNKKKLGILFMDLRKTPNS